MQFYKIIYKAIEGVMKIYKILEIYSLPKDCILPQKKTFFDPDRWSTRYFRHTPIMLNMKVSVNITKKPRTNA